LSSEQSSCSISSKECAHQDYKLDQLKKQNNHNEVDFWEDDKYFKDEWISPIIRDLIYYLLKLYLEMMLKNGLYIHNKKSDFR
jgi:hypothetical protein